MRRTEESCFPPGDFETPKSRPSSNEHHQKGEEKKKSLKFVLY